MPIFCRDNSFFNTTHVFFNFFFALLFSFPFSIAFYKSNRPLRHIAQSPEKTAQI